MKHHATDDFWTCYERLPQSVRDTADRSFELLKSSPYHPSLHFKKVGRFWSARVGLSWRALAIQQNDDIVWFWIGSHSDYDKLLR